MAVKKRASELFMPGYQLKPSDKSKLNWSIKGHRGMVDKLNVILKDLKEHHSTLFQSIGLALKQGEKFVHSLNVKQIKCVEVKLTKVRQDREAPEHEKRSYDSIFKGTQTAHRQKKEKRKPQKAK